MPSRTICFLAVFAAIIASSRTAVALVFGDTFFSAADYTTTLVGNTTVEFNANYGAIDVFGDGFLTASIPEAPNSSPSVAAQTGVFISANNNSLVSSTESFSSISPKLSDLNVGSGTTTPNFVMQVDVWHNTGTGVDVGGGTIDVTGTTTNSYLGINQSNTKVRIQENNATQTTGQGVGLAITGDAGAADDYLPHYGGVGYRLRPGLGMNVTNDGTNFRSGLEDNPLLRPGLMTEAISEAWRSQGFDYSTGDPSTELSQFTGDALHFAPDPTNPEGYRSDGSGQNRQYFAEAFPTHNDPLAVSAALPQPSFPAANDTVTPGVPYNRWATHRLYFIDDVFTYTIEDSVIGNEVVIVEKLINDPNDAGADTVFDPVSNSGSVVLGFWDRFGGSIALSPEGANFVVYDNLSVSAASSGDAPTAADAISDFVPVPEPNTLILLAASGLALLTRRTGTR